MSPSHYAVRCLQPIKWWELCSTVVILHQNNPIAAHLIASGGSSTNNNAEVLHGSFRQLVGHSNPTIWGLISAMKQEQSLTDGTITCVLVGELPPKRIRKNNYIRRDNCKLNGCLQCDVVLLLDFLDLVMDFRWIYNRPRVLVYSCNLVAVLMHDVMQLVNINGYCEIFLNNLCINLCINSRIITIMYQILSLNWYKFDTVVVYAFTPFSCYPGFTIEIPRVPDSLFNRWAPPNTLLSATSQFSIY